MGGGDMKLNRGQKTVRNLVLCALLWALVYAMLGFPPYTVRGMLARLERQYLLSDLQPVMVERDSRRYSNDLFSHHRTYLIARSGDTYVFADFTRHVLEVDMGYRWNKIDRNVVCAACNGTLYVAGDFTEAASAVAEVTVQRTTQWYDPDTKERTRTTGERKTFTYQGEKVNDALFSFYYREEGEPDSWGPWGPNTGLEGAAYNWYSGYVRGSTGGGRSILHADLPVKVTLYDAGGGVLDTLELTIDNYEIYSTW